MINKLESIQKRAIKWILNEEYHHYNDIEYICRLRDVNLLPLKYYFILNDLVIFHKIFYNLSCVKLPFYLRPCDENDRSRLRSNVNPPDYYNSQSSTLDLSTMRATSLDKNSLKCTVIPIATGFKNCFFLRCHMLWNYLSLDIRTEQSPQNFKRLLLLHLWDDLMKPD